MSSVSSAQQNSAPLLSIRILHIHMPPHLRRTYGAMSSVLHASFICNISSVLRSASCAQQNFEPFLFVWILHICVPHLMRICVYEERSICLARYLPHSHVTYLRYCGVPLAPRQIPRHICLHGYYTSKNGANFSLGACRIREHSYNEVPLGSRVCVCACCVCDWMVSRENADL